MKSKNLQILPHIFHLMRQGQALTRPPFPQIDSTMSSGALGPVQCGKSGHANGLNCTPPRHGGRKLVLKLAMVSCFPWMHHDAPLFLRLEVNILEVKGRLKNAEIALQDFVRSEMENGNTSRQGRLSPSYINT